MPRQIKSVHLPDANDLFPGITITEAAALTGYHRRTILYHLLEGNLRARKSGRIWLIDIESIDQLIDGSKLNFNFIK